MLDWFYVDVQLFRHNQNALISNTKRVPRVRFYWGYDYSYMNMKTIGVYWSPRTPCSEGEVPYRHHFRISWRPVFHFSWR